MDADLVSIISQKKNAIKTLSLKGTELNSSKSIKINGDMTYTTVFTIILKLIQPVKNRN